MGPRLHSGGRVNLRGARDHRVSCPRLELASSMPTFLPVELVNVRHDNVGEGLEAQEALQGSLLAGKVDNVPGAVE
eukprot:767059-Pyramimonas_sp.AAC.1